MIRPGLRDDVDTPADLVNDVKVVVLSGGVGGARFVQGLVEADRSE